MAMVLSYKKHRPWAENLSIVLQIGLTPPAGRATHMASFAGSLKFKVHTTVVVDNVRGKTGQTVADEALQQYGSFQIIAPSPRDGEPDETVDVVVCRGAVALDLDEEQVEEAIAEVEEVFSENRDFFVG